MESKELILKHVKVIFAELEDKGFGRNLTIDATEPESQKQISEWVKVNNINGGVAKFKDYTNKDGITTKQYNFKFSDYTDIAGKEEATDLGYGAVVNILAKAYEYDNKFGKGISASLASVYVVEPKINSNMDKIAE